MFKSLALFVFVSTAGCSLCGCYEDVDPAPPQQGQRPAQPANQGSLGPGAETANPSLGKAKQSATNIVERAEQHSQEVADQADEMLNDDGG